MYRTREIRMQCCLRLPLLVEKQNRIYRFDGRLQFLVPGVPVIVRLSMAGNVYWASWRETKGLAKKTREKRKTRGCLWFFVRRNKEPQLDILFLLEPDNAPSTWVTERSSPRFVLMPILLNWCNRIVSLCFISTIPHHSHYYKMGWRIFNIYWFTVCKNAQLLYIFKDSK